MAAPASTPWTGVPLPDFNAELVIGQWQEGAVTHVFDRNGAYRGADDQAGTWRILSARYTPAVPLYIPGDTRLIQVLDDSGEQLYAVVDYAPPTMTLHHVGSGDTLAFTRTT